MTGPLDRKTIASIFEAGIGLCGDIPAPTGNVSEWLEPDDVPDFIHDRGAWFAKKHGVTKEDYLGWLEADGLPRCGATTGKGTRCRNPVSGGSQRGLLDWLNEEAGFCTVHGGESSKEAGAKRWSRKQ
jgi:hypothetical protein